MAWRRDPATGEWEMIDPNVPDPMTQSTTGQELDPSLRDPLPPEGPYEGGFGPSGAERGYTTGDAGVYPVMSPQMVPGRTGEGAPIYGGSQASPPELPVSRSAGYDNVDYAVVDQWVQDVQARGNEIRKTGVGTFEVGEGNRILSKMPTAAYRTN